MYQMHKFIHHLSIGIIWQLKRLFFGFYINLIQMQNLIGHLCEIYPVH